MEKKILNFTDTDWYEEYCRVAKDTAYAKEKLLAQMKALVGRVIGEKWQQFFVFVLKEPAEKDFFELWESDGKIHICGNNGIALASGFHYYLKNYAYVNYNPLFGSNVKMPEKLPTVKEKVVKQTPYAVRYQLNFCTYGYTMAFWGWEEYEALLDWYAMNGVNTMLDLVGQEEIQRRLLREFGYTEEELVDYIPGPAYFPWFFMQNMSGWGGPLPEAWYVRQVELGRRIHDRMQNYGISPVLMGYAGMVPNDFSKKNPDACVIKQGKWCGFEVPDMLMVDGETGRDYYSELADTFYQKQKRYSAM